MAPKSTRSVKSVLQEALACLERQGWCQHELQNADGQVCLDGALRYAIWGDAAHPCFTIVPGNTHRELYVRVWHFLGTQVPVLGLTLWNDTPGRTWHEVRTMLKTATREAR